MVKLSAEGIKSLHDTDSLVQCLKEAGLNKRALDFLQEQHISGEDFLELTYNELDSRGLELGPMKSILRTIDKINKTEQVNNDIDESLIQSFEEFSVKEIAAVVMHIKDEKRLGQKLSSMTDLENKILDEIYEVDKNKSVPKDQWPKVFDEPFDHFGFLRPMTLSSFKKNHG
uniref:SAM domain-containing protein n=1 Tax=Rhizophagus irregularis (strain DAOM 181602 / DAOM 197198 / MUCL 43194) TaxID=747089 RepID=U9TGL5_RHIID